MPSREWSLDGKVCSITFHRAVFVLVFDVAKGSKGIWWLPSTLTVFFLGQKTRSSDWWFRVVWQVVLCFPFFICLVGLCLVFKSVQLLDLTAILTRSQMNALPGKKIWNSQKCMPKCCVPHWTFWVQLSDCNDKHVPPFCPFLVFCFFCGWFCLPVISLLLLGLGKRHG